MAKREFLMLAHKYREGKDLIAGHFVSEKLDGQRAFWDGGITAGMLASDVPWANTERDARYLEAPRATGLWTRYGNIIHAPTSWLKSMPGFPLDGELYLGRGMFQTLRKVVSPRQPDPEEWEAVKYMVFDMPAYDVVFADGKINTTNYKKTINNVACHKFYGKSSSLEAWPFWQTYTWLHRHLVSEVCHVHEQTRLPYSSAVAEATCAKMLDEVCDNGGEGLIIRRESSLWVPCRSHDLMKVKKLHDAEATVIGYRFGKVSDNTRTVSGTANSKLLGKIGALIVKFDDVEFELGGLTDEERDLGIDCQVAAAHPGEKAPDWVRSKHFPRGSQVTFRYRELSDDGIPKEARYWRKR